MITKTTTRLWHSLTGNIKPFSTRDISGTVVDTYKKWIKLQMSPEMHWSNIEIDHLKPICLFDVSKDEELREAFNWKNTQPLSKQAHIQKGTKFNFLIIDYNSLRLTNSSS